MGTRPASFDEAPTEEQLESWRRGASERQANAEQLYARSGVSWVHRRDPMAPEGVGPIPPPIIAELDALTELAFANLVQPFAHLSLDLRSCRPTWRERPEDLPGGPDLVLEDTMIEIKLSETGAFQRRWAVQLVRYLLLDSEDKYRFNKVAIYEGRTGSLVTFPLGEFVKGGRPGLTQARQVWRKD